MSGRGQSEKMGKKNAIEKARVRNVRGEYEALKQIFRAEEWTDGMLSSKVDVLKVTYSIICAVLGIQPNYLHLNSKKRRNQRMSMNEYAVYSDPATMYNSQYNQAAEATHTPLAQYSQAAESTNTSLAQYSRGVSASSAHGPLEPPKWLLRDPPPTLTSQDNGSFPSNEKNLVCAEEVFYSQESDEEEDYASTLEEEEVHQNGDGGMPLNSSPSQLYPSQYQQHSSYSSMNPLPPFAHVACMVPINDAYDSSFLLPYSNNSANWACCCPQPPDYLHPPVNMESPSMQHLNGLASPLRCFPYHHPQ